MRPMPATTPKHIRESVPYGDWEIPIQFEKTSTGGGCTPGCHNPKAYDRNVPVIYKTKETEAEKKKLNDKEVAEESKIQGDTIYEGH